MECGFETGRLQWTHFKFKCTGRFSNSKEYQLVYPDAPVVSAEVASRTGVTREKLIEKYGSSEGIIRWDQYRSKQAESNSFEYKKEKHGWTKEQFDEFNSSRASTLLKMIERHGEDQGTVKWMSYCERQAYTNSKQYFIDRYGIDDGTRKFLKLNKEKGNSNNPIFISQQLGISVDEAVQLILNRSSSFGKLFGSNLEQEFTAMLVDKTGHLEYTTFTRPYGRWSNLLESYVIYDIKHNDCIIEFNGDYWHANPAIYADSAIIRGKTAVEIRERDYKKIKTAKELGFRTYVVWESDFRLDKNETIRKVKEWMLNGQQ